MQRKTVIYSHKKVGNIYVVYDVTNFPDIDSYPVLANTLFGAVKFTKNADSGKYKDILDMELDLMEKDFIHTLVVEQQEM